MLMTHPSRNYGKGTANIPTDRRLTETNGVPWYPLLRDGRRWMRFQSGSGESPRSLWNNQPYSTFAPSPEP